MSRRRGSTGLSGILPLDKPAGMTSHDVVGLVRRITGEGRVGHAGTLDPAATGLLVVLVGPMTRLAPWLSGADKAYEARIEFGAEMDTDDAEGAVTRLADVPPSLAEESAAAAAVAGMIGEHLQEPPAFSAIKVGGRTAHRVARSGGEIELAPRQIAIYDANLVWVDPGPPIAWTIRMSVSKGTYVRSLARDVGRALGTAAHLSGLRRTRSGALTLDDAHTLDDVQQAADVAALFTDPVRALGLPVLEVDAACESRVANGALLPLPPGAPSPQAALTPAGAPSLVPSGQSVAIVGGGRLLAVYDATEAELKPSVVLSRSRS